MKYIVIGAGGTGGSIGAYMTEAGKDVTLIARGAHLEAMQKNGLQMETTRKGNYTVKPVKAADMEHYDEQPDVIFVCVKGYSLEDTVPFIQKVAKPETVVIPILNIYGTGGRLQEKLPELLVTDGCIYIAAEIKRPGCIWQNGDIFRVVFGVREPSQYRPEDVYKRQCHPGTRLHGEHRRPDYGAEAGPRLRGGFPPDRIFLLSRKRDCRSQSLRQYPEI